MSVIGGIGCTSSQQIVPLVIEPPPGPIEVAAPLSRTWDAVLEAGIQHQWPRATVARDSGLFVTGPISFKGLDDSERNRVAYGCGITGPFYTTLTIHVRGDSTRSTIEVTPRLYGINDQECVTTGRIERSLANEIEARAEGTFRR